MVDEYAALRYVPPPWASLTGSSNYSLEILKNGCIVDTKELSPQGHIVLGRMAPICDLVLDHPSISRQHAVLQLNQENQLFLQDLNSTHGTFRNKTRLEPRVFEPVTVGDIFTLGQSSRKFCITGCATLLPEEIESSGRKAFRDQVASISAEEGEQHALSSGISWGITSQEDDEEVLDENGNENEEHDSDLPEYLVQHQRRQLNQGQSSDPGQLLGVQGKVGEKLYARWKSRASKVENLKLEKKRILAKEFDQPSGLSSGQVATLDRNERRLVSLEGEMQALEQELAKRSGDMSKAQARAQAQKEKKTKSVEDRGVSSGASTYYPSDEDDFYDRTKSKSKSKSSKTAQQPEPGQTKVETFDSLQDRELELRQQRRVVQDTINTLMISTRSSSMENGSNIGEQEDTLDSYVRQSSLDMIEENMKKEQRQLDHIQEELKRVEKLIQLTRPALERGTATTVVLPSPVVVEISQNSSAISCEGINEEKSSDIKNHSTPVVADSHKEGASSSSSLLASSRSTMAIQEKLKPPRNNKRSSCTNSTEVVHQRHSSSPKKTRKVLGPANPHRATETEQQNNELIHDQHILEGGDIEWIPPSNQTGDGKTALNLKYGY